VAVESAEAGAPCVHRSRARTAKVDDLDAEIAFVRELGGELAALTLDRWRCGQLDLPPPDLLDLITWVPHARVRAAKRGCHAPEIFARALGARLSLPCQPLLTRCTEAPQRGRDIAGRREHAHRAFTLAKHGSSNDLVQPGMRALVIDDVRTTGATLDACCELLQKLGLVTHQLAVVAVPRHTQKRGGGRV